jgi:hypothetical protein
MLPPELPGTTRVLPMQLQIGDRWRSGTIDALQLFLIAILLTVVLALLVAIRALR